MNGRQKAGVAGVVLASASLVGFVTHWEGTEYVPYRDIVGVWTVCEGITGPHVIVGKTYTQAECRALTGGAIEKHGRELLACIKAPIEQHVYEALASWAYNVGTGAACGSTLVRMVNAGRPAIEFCEQLLRWNRAGGREVRGLTNRRKAEYQTCVNAPEGRPT